MTRPAAASAGKPNDAVQWPARGATESGPQAPRAWNERSWELGVLLRLGCTHADVGARVRSNYHAQRQAHAAGVGAAKVAGRPSAAKAAWWPLAHGLQRELLTAAVLVKKNGGE